MPTTTKTTPASRKKRIEVVDGDTLHANCDGLKIVTIRLFGADAPEMNQPSLAWWSPQYAPDSRDLRLAEDTARAAKRGLWAMPAPVPPWQWRKSH